MDRLETCMDALRDLARSNDPDRAAIVEGHIDAYLTTETVSVWQALERLRKGIRDEQAERREGRELEHSERIYSLCASWAGLVNCGKPLVYGNVPFLNVPLITCGAVEGVQIGQPIVS
jgi:hypothetical protein